MLRNEKALGLLDLDVMMNRTHTIYDKLCSINLGSTNNDVEVDPEMLQALFGGVDDEDEEMEEEDAFPEEMEEPEPIDTPEELEKEQLEEPDEPEVPEIPEEPEPLVEPEEPDTPEIEETDAPEIKEETDFGFIFKLDEPEETQEPEETTIPEEPEVPEVPEEAPVEEVKSSGVYTTGDQIEMEIPHLDLFDTLVPEEENEEEQPEEIEETVEEMVEENDEEQVEENDGEQVEEIVEEQVEEVVEETPEISYEPIIFGEMDAADDGGFEFEGPETLGDRMQHEEDHSLAARLQSQTVRNLRSAIGINDKFLFVNELFGGSMEKYNRSIENLDDVKTLNGALIYLNELRIELQWNSNNEAYTKLLELVHRKFE